MTRAYDYPPIIRWGRAIQGLLAGGLTVGGILIDAGPYGVPIQIILFIAGVGMFLDAIVPDGEMSLMASVGFAIIGGFVSIVGAVAGFLPYWAAILVIAAVLFSLQRFSRKSSKAA